jgi:DNA (cytosine-5)-methyltransferase 1
VRAIDLFAGAGGATAGLRDAGFDVVAAIENDPAACDSYRLNHKDTVLIEEDILDVTPDQLLEAVGMERGDLTLLQACPPCQTWSSLGKGAKDDPRNELLTRVTDFIRGLRPAAFVIENVPGLRSDARLTQLIADAAEDGYAAKVYIVDASAVAVPQRRKRLIALGVRGAAGEDLPTDFEDLLPDDFERGRRTVQDAIGHLLEGPVDDELHRWRTLGDLALRRVKALKPGGRRFDLPQELRLACHEALSARNATASYGRMKGDDIAPTLTTRCTTPACGAFVHPTEDRGISLREAALLQTFWPDYQFSGTYGAIERQIGNAIPVRLAQAAATVAAALVAKVEAA